MGRVKLTVEMDVINYLASIDASRPIAFDLWCLENRFDRGDLLRISLKLVMRDALNSFLHSR